MHGFSDSSVPDNVASTAVPEKPSLTCHSIQKDTNASEVKSVAGQASGDVVGIHSCC